MMATADTSGTNRVATPSASRWYRPLDSRANRTSSTTRDSVPFSGVSLTAIVRSPSRSSVPPRIRSPVSLRIGRLSPVSTCSSTEALWATTQPSAGNRSPGSTRNRSPIWTCPRGINSSTPSLMRRTCSGSSLPIASSAAFALSLPVTSSQRPSVVITRMKQPTSK